MIPRTFHHIEHLDSPVEEAYMRDTPEERDTPVDEGVANIISSRVVGSDEVLDDGTQWMHAPVLDIDFPCALIPSTTPGHFHLYIDKPMDWFTYEYLLIALGRAGILESGYVEASLIREATFVRKPFVSKPTPPEPEPEPVTF